MMRVLTIKEIEDILDFIVPQEGIPIDTAISIVERNKNSYRKQLKGVKLYPAIIPKLKESLRKDYLASRIQAGESVGIIGAQSIGEKNTQSTLNSVDWEEKLMYTKNGKVVVQPIGEMIDGLLEQRPDNITHIKENRTEYLELKDGYMVPSTDEDGNVAWYKIEAVTRHLPVGKLVKVITQSGRTVMATQSKSFLVWNGEKFEGVLGSEVKSGDFLPTTHTLPRPKDVHTHFDMQTIFPKEKYLYTTEIHNVLTFQREHGGLQSRKVNNFAKHNGTTFTVPYNRYDTMMGKRKEYFTTCKPGLVYIHTSNGFVSHIPDKIPLDNDFGFFVGLYLSEGWCTQTFVGISNNDEAIRKRITDYCDRYGVTYHLVTSKGKNVRQGISNDLKIHSTLLARMFKIICDTGSANKRVPEFAYTAPIEFIKGLIDGYYSGDGCVTRDGIITVSSVSEDLILGISSLLSYFGIFGRLSSYLQKKNNVGSKNIKRTYVLNISNGFAQQFAREILLSEAKKQDRLTNITLEKKYRYAKGRSQEAFPDRDVYFDEVVSVEYVDGTTEYVYDLTVAITRNFQLWNGLQNVDTFHKAGVSEKTMTAGVPRFQELLNTTKNPSIVNHKIYYPDKYNTIQELREEVGHTIAGLTMEDLSTEMNICMNQKEKPWYNVFKVLYGEDRFANHSHCISVKLNMKKLYEFRLTAKDIADHIHNEYGDLFCVFSPPNIGELDIYTDTNPDNLTLPEDRVMFVDNNNAVYIYMEECVFPTIANLCVKGIPGILEIFYTKDEKTDEWFVETNSIDSKKISSQYSSFKRLLALPNIDMSRTISNHVWDIYEVLGIEAAREFLIEEFMSIMDGINKCHAEMLVDRMTHGGVINSISRYTLRKDESGPMGKASFEETQENFIKAAAQGDKEPTLGVSASIICGKRAAIGTGMTDLKIDISQLPISVEVDDEKDRQLEARIASLRGKKKEKETNSGKKVLVLDDMEDVEDDDEDGFLEI